MARLAEDHDFAASHGNGKYPWTEWQDGSPREIVRGEDFEVAPKVMQGQIKVRGDKIGRRTVTNVKGDSVFFAFQRQGEHDAEFRQRTKPTP